MSFKFQCACGQHYMGSQNLIGRKLLCKSCMTKVAIPAPTGDARLPVASAWQDADPKAHARTKPFQPPETTRAAPRPNRGRTRYPTMEAKSLLSPAASSTILDRLEYNDSIPETEPPEFETPPQGLDEAMSELEEFALDLKKMQAEETGKAVCGMAVTEGSTRPYGQRDLAVLLGSGFRRACSSRRPGTQA